MSGYFSNFPTIDYKGKAAKDIMKRGRVKEQILQDTTPFEPFELKEMERADYLAELLYNRPQLDYLFYISNNIIDPYYEWYLTADQLAPKIDEKYGTQAFSVKYYEYWNRYQNTKNPSIIIDVERFIVLSISQKELYEKVETSRIQITPETYNNLSPEFKAVCVGVSFASDEQRENDKRKFINVPSATIGIEIHRQLRSLLNDQPLAI